MILSFAGMALIKSPKMKTPRKAKVLKSFVTKKKKSCLKTSLKAKPKSSNKPRKIENYDCNFVDELKLRSRVRINKHFVKKIIIRTDGVITHF